jgi:hypothetical protein
VEEEDTLRSEYMDQLIKVASEIDALDYLSDNEISFCRLDLAVRNILVGPYKSPVISGILVRQRSIYANIHVLCASNVDLELERMRISGRPTILFPLLKRAN